MKPVIITLLLSCSVFAQVQTGWRPAVLRAAGIDQKLDAQAPLDLPFSDESGHRVTLRQYSGKPR